MPRRAVSAKKTGVVARLYKKSASKAGRKYLEDLFMFQCRAAGLQIPAREVKFHPIRRWRFDFIFVHPKNTGRLIAMEIEGGVFINGGHNRGVGHTSDIEKFNEASLLGYTVFRATAAHVKSGQALAWIESALK